MEMSSGWITCPAFMSAADSASSTGSTAGKAAFSTANAVACSRAGNTPVGRRVARAVIATVAGPCLRVSQGSVLVSAIAKLARLPDSRISRAMA